MLPKDKKKLTLKIIKEQAEKRRKEAAEALKDELTGYLEECSKCELNGSCLLQENMQRNLDFGPTDGHYHEWLE